MQMRTHTLPPPHNARKYLNTETVSELCHCSSVAKLVCDLTMFIHCELIILSLALALHGKGK